MRTIKLRAALIGVLALTVVNACDAKDEEPRPTPKTSDESTEAAMAEPQGWQRYGFDQDAVGGPPAGFTAVLSGNGKEGRWQVVTAADAPSGGQAVAQLDADRTGYRFPLLVLDSLTARDVELEVAGKPISGGIDQAIGLIWRYQNADNYYVLRANALEDNVVLYKMEAGKRSDLDLKGRGRTYGLDVEIPSGTWSRLGVSVRGNRFSARLDGRELFEVEDDTFAGPGQVGLWTKADSVTWFDDFGVRVLDGPAATGEPETDR